MSWRIITQTATRLFDLLNLNTVSDMGLYLGVLLAVCLFLAHTTMAYGVVSKSGYLEVCHLNFPMHYNLYIVVSICLTIKKSSLIYKS